jgi:DNA-directed RNA polymerase sigma subunit (sigma70/sigma32)
MVIPMKKVSIEFHKDGGWTSPVGNGRSISDMMRKLSKAGFVGELALPPRIRKRAKDLTDKRLHVVAASRRYRDAERVAVKHLREGGMSLRDVAVVLGLSRERIRQIEGL